MSEPRVTRERIEDWKPGDRAVWSHSPRGGYGYVFPIKVEVLEVQTNRVKVRAPLSAGGTKDVFVKPENLRRPSGARQSG